MSGPADHQDLLFEAARRSRDGRGATAWTATGAATADDDAATAILEELEDRGWLRRAALYPQAYAWYVLLSGIDLIFTWLILAVGGREVNLVADWVLRKHDVAGVVLFKFLLVGMVLLLCEFIGRRDFERGLKLARWAVAINPFPVLVGAFHLLSLTFAPDPG